MTKRRRLALLAAIAAIAVAAALAWRHYAAGPAEIELTVFEDVTAASGIDYTGMTHGAAWGDFDGAVPHVMNHAGAGAVEAHKANATQDTLALDDGLQEFLIAQPVL